MPSSVVFFTPVDPVDINTLLGLTGDLAWIIQTGTPSTSKDFKNMLKANGDQAAWKAHNEVLKIAAVYKCQALTGTLTLPKVGLVTGGYHIDNVALVYGIDYPTLTVQMHKHTGATNHADASCHTYAAGVVFPAQFGVPSSLNDGAGVTFAVGSAAIGVKSLNYSLACTHLDELNGSGEWLAGENHDGVETLDAELTGSPETADLTVAATWHKATDGAPNGNTVANTRSINLLRHISQEA